MEQSNAAGALPVGYGYDALGRLASRSIGSSTDSFTYEALGRLKTHTNPLGKFTLAYDGQSSRPLSETLGGMPWRTQYSWDTVAKDHMLTGITHGPTALSRNPGTMARLQGLAKSLGLTAQQSLAGGVIPADWSSANDIGYTNATGQIASRTQGLDSWRYAYDDLLRLTGVSYTGSNASGRSNVYDYDTTDNLTRITSTPGAITTFTPTVDNQVSTVTGSGQTTAWLYDADGNLTDDGVNTYLWDAEQRLIRIKRKGDGQTSNIAYDGLGRRTSITETKQGDTAPNKTTRYVYCGSPTPCAANGTTGLTILEPQGEYNASSTPTQQYYAKDHQGSVMQMVDGQGNTLGTRQYTVYGQTMQASGVAPTLGYAGMLYHAPSGLYLTPHRAYNPGNGRWLSRDPIGESGGGNLYGYGGENPVSSFDPFGLYPAILVTLPDGSQYIPLTRVKNSAQAASFGLPLGAITAIAVPPGVNPMSQVNGWSGWNARGPAPFAWYWRPGGPNDYKLQNSMYDAYGNFAYGATGAATDQYTCGVLTGMGNLLHGGHNNPINTRDITSGYNAINMGGTLSIIDYTPPKL